MLAEKPTKVTCVSLLRILMETSYKNSVSLRQGNLNVSVYSGQNSVSLRQRNLNQFSVSVLRQWRSQAGAHWGTLGHTGARALATEGCAPPVQALLKIIGAECTIINRKLGAKSAQRC